MSAVIRLGKAACQTCRARHLDCDRVEPVCSSCAESDRICKPGYNPRFRRHRDSSAADAGLHGKGRLKFSIDQAWTQTPTTLSFVDESPATVTVQQPREPSTTRTQSQDLGLPHTSTSVNGRVSKETRSAVRIDFLCNPLLENDISQQRDQESLPCPASPTRPLSLYTESDGLLQGRHVELLHYFKSAVGWPWFDVADPDFTREALHLAPRCPLLLFAMLATAAIHRSRFVQDPVMAQDYENEAEAYHEKCVKLLIPMLHEKEAVIDGAFLACSTILRFYEEISAPFHGRDDARHLLGGYAAVAQLQNQQLSCTGLGKPAFWVHQRQDTYNSIINQRVPKTNLECCGLDRSVAPADDYVWAKRSTCLMAECVEFGFGDSPSTEKYEAVMARLKNWFLSKPETFAPVYSRERNPSSGRMFPEICLLMDYATFGLTYYYFCMLFMTLFDPTIPRIGMGYLDGRRRTQERVLDYLRILCGLAISNPVPPARVISCLAVSQCGAWVTERTEQDAVLGVLLLVDREDAWPSSSTAALLKAQWAQAADS